MFMLNDTQRTRLAALRATLDEGERRFDVWTRREAQAQAAQTFGEVLTAAGLRSGKALTPDSRTRLLRAAAELAPNGNLSKRLYSNDPLEFDNRLRCLLFGLEPIITRLREFLRVRGTGAQTASSLLSALAPDTYPLITLVALRRLKLTAAQRRDALAEAAERYGFDFPQQPDAAQSLLALFVVYEQIRTALNLTYYPEVDAALRADVPITTEHSASLANTTVREGSAAYSSALTETRLLASIEEYALSQGFTFPSYRLRSYYIALKTKPFAILSGVSGTGKTRMAELFAEAMTGHHPKQFQLIPVRPDWNDSAALFGYQNILASRYVSTPFLEIVRRAALPENRHRAFFVCLDELNLARVEHYLADYLSALESRGHRIPLHEDVPDLILPANLFVTGTVNVDETTHSFSRKVLDRANTLDFEEAPLLRGQKLSKGIVRLEDELGGSVLQRQALFLAARAASISKARERLSQIDPAFSDRALTLLESANALLYASRLHFAYRVRDEVLMFLANSFDAETNSGLLLADKEENFALAFDLQIIQKVLPKLHGLSETLTPLLASLQRWAETNALAHTAAKLAQMRHRGEETGYIRFYD